MKLKAENKHKHPTDLRKYVVEMENLTNRRKARAGYRNNKGIHDHGKTRAATHIRSGEGRSWLTNSLPMDIGHQWETSKYGQKSMEEKAQANPGTGTEKLVLSKLSHKLRDLRDKLVAQGVESSQRGTSPGDLSKTVGKTQNP